MTEQSSSSKTPQPISESQSPLAPKAVSESSVVMRQIVLPNDANTHGNILGGQVLHLVDIAAAMAAIRHCRQPVVTASIDQVSFLNPIPVGHFIILNASVNYTGNTSMEIGVKVCSENPFTGEYLHTSTAYLTFVALTKDKKPSPVPPVLPETDEEQRRFQKAKKRVRIRRKRRQEEASGN